MTPDGPRPEEIRAARSFLHAPHVKNRFAKLGVSQARVRPQAFAASAKELGVGFDQLMQLIEHLYMGSGGAQLERKQIIARGLPASQGGTGVLGPAAEA